VSFVGVLGESLITAGVLVLMFIGWQQWFNNIVVSGDTSSQASKLSQELEEKATASPAPAPTSSTGAVEPAVTPAASGTEQFGVLYVPRWGADYQVPIAEGTTTAGTLDKGDAGHYDSTQMPGAVGNFAIAGHRTTHGAPFGSIASLRVGDHIYVKTSAGYYTYTFRNLEYVKPTQVQVLQQVPDAPTVAAGSKDRLITMTSCNPKYSAAERIVAFGVFTSWQPLSAGAPAEIKTVAGKA
jgi:sortase A